MHGCPMNNCEVSLTKSTLFSFGLGPRMEREERVFGLFAPKPNIRGSLGAY